MVFLPKEKTNPATYYKSPIWPYPLVTAECPNWQGIYVDYSYITSSVSMMGRYVEFVTGEASTSGIMALKRFSYATDEAETKYVRFALDISEINKFYDELSIKYYDTLASAEADIPFADPTVYVRDDDKGTPAN